MPLTSTGGDSESIDLAGFGWITGATSKELPNLAAESFRHGAGGPAAPSNEQVSTLSDKRPGSRWPGRSIDESNGVRSQAEF